MQLRRKRQIHQTIVTVPPQLTINVNAGHHFFHCLSRSTDYFLLPPTTQHLEVWWSSIFHQPSFVLSAASRAAWTAAEEDLHSTLISTAQVAATRSVTLACNLATTCTDLVPSAPTLTHKWIVTAAHRPRRSLSARTPTLHNAVPLRQTLASPFLYPYLCLRYHLTSLGMATTIAVQSRRLVRPPRPTMSST
jgi:hypothetical protein